MKVDPRDRNLYRNSIAAADLLRCQVVIKETDLLVLSDQDLRAIVWEIVLNQRDRLERYIAANPAFQHSLVPLAVPETAPAIVKSMAAAGKSAGVGPMAAVAGAICEAVAQGVGPGVRELILENGGDIYVATTRERLVGIFTGEKARSRSVGLRIAPELTPTGICTSSGRIGHSLSLGDSAAATVIAGSCALADAAATAVGNRVRGKDGIREGLAAARDIPGVLGVVVVRDGRLGAWGDVEIVGLREVSEK